MYHCILCGQGFIDGLRVTIETNIGVQVVYVCHNCACGKNEKEVCRLAAKKNYQKEFFPQPAYAN